MIDPVYISGEWVLACLIVRHVEARGVSISLIGKAVKV